MGVTMPGPTPMYCDSKSAIQIAKNKFFRERTKHIEVDYHVTRYHFKMTGIINLSYISSSNLVANLFSKYHIVAHFCFLVHKLSMFIPL